MARVLIVLDGGYRFSEATGIPDFTYTVLADALASAGHQVTKAHRQTDGSADIQSFNFATSVNLLDHDVLWLIGFEGRNSTTATGTSGAGIGETELAAIARFMEAGGGVFATGDHDSIGAEMCGRIPRVRAMRCWYGANDGASPMPADFPRNFPPLTPGRADTTRQNPLGDYDLNDDGTDEAFVWFENQSDSVPQTIAPTTSPAHAILRRGGGDITVYPDHMHEGNTLGVVGGYDYTQSLTLDGQAFAEFPAIAGHREMPEVVATGQTVAFASRYAHDNSFLDTAMPYPKTINTLSAYDGRVAGVGRVVTGATFHHYVDINLTGDSRIDTPAEFARTGPDAEKGHGFAHPGAEATFEAIKAVYDNIATWLARPRPRIQLILERSTFSQDEANANPQFEGAILVTVDGLKPSQFPGGGITTLSPTAAQLAGWAPSIAFTAPAGLAIVATGVASDDPALPDRLQRITFTYRIEVTGAAFGFGGTSSTVRVDASLASAAISSLLTDFAWIQLVKSANPFMLDLANGNTTPWLSSDVRVIPVVAGGDPVLGQTLVADATRAQALAFLRDLVSGMSVAEFESLPTGQDASALSPFPTTTGTNRKVYNLAVARVRLSGAGAAANAVRVFFRIFTSQTTAALTYRESPPGVPIEGYRRTAGANPIALPGTNAAGNEWLSFPMFSASRMSPPEAQTDGDNVKTLSPGSSTFYGALIDNNLTDAYLPATPISGGGAVGLPTLMMGEHQCIVAQIEFAGTPIPSGATPFTSDKLSQRNIALSAIANPGLDASRVALHTFEIEATPRAIAEDRPPDELLLEWRRGAPDGTEVRVFIPTWSAAAVVELADRLYPRHEIRAIDAHTVSVPGSGLRYLPIPTSTRRQTGVITARFPLGVKKGQRFDLSIRQVTTRGRRVDVAQPNVKRISLEEAGKIIRDIRAKVPDPDRGEGKDDGVERGVFPLGRNTILVTDLRALDAAGDHAVIIEHPDPEKIAEARRQAGRWRETIGAFQLGIPVSVKEDMLTHHLRLLSVLRWRAEWLRSDSRWYDTFLRYVDLIAEKVRALGGDPWTVPATPDGTLPPPDKGGVGTPGEGGVPAVPGDPSDPLFEPGDDDWLGDTGGLDTPDKAMPVVRSGKVSGLLFDHFGDFEGFTLESHAGAHFRFFSRETSIHDLARTAWIERYVVTVITVSAQSRRVRRVLIRGYSD
jgi:hypothetical protein